MMSVASSTTPGMDWNSCSTPSILTAVTAAPSMELSSTRRSALPMVVPNPRSNGCAQKIPYLSVRVEVSTARRFGFWKPFQSMCFSFDHMAQPRLPGSPSRLSALRRLIWCEMGKIKASTTKDMKYHEGLRGIPLLAVQLNNQLLVHRQLNIFALGQIQYPRLGIVRIAFH